MPCNSDYLDPTKWEVEASKVLALLEEVKTGDLPEWFGRGTHHLVYNKISKEKLDEWTAELCKLLSKEDVSLFSLEMQMWYREHKKADAKRDMNQKRISSEINILLMTTVHKEFYKKPELSIFEYNLVKSSIDLFMHGMDMSVLNNDEKNTLNEVHNILKKPVKKAIE